MYRVPPVRQGDAAAQVALAVDGDGRPEAKLLPVIHDDLGRRQLPHVGEGFGRQGAGRLAAVAGDQVAHVEEVEVGASQVLHEFEDVLVKWKCRAALGLGDAAHVGLDLLAGAHRRRDAGPGADADDAEQQQEERQQQLQAYAESHGRCQLSESGRRHLPVYLRETRFAVEKAQCYGANVQDGAAKTSWQIGQSARWSGVFPAGRNFEF